MRAPVGYSCQWLSGAPDIFKIKITGGNIKPLFEAAALAFFGVWDLPASGHCLTQPFIHLHSRIFPKIHTHFSKKSP